MNFFFSLKEGLAGFRRARLASFITVTSVALALLLVGYFVLFSMNMNHWIGEKRSEIELEVFLENTMKDAEGQKIADKIKKMEGILQVTYISKEEAARRFQREFGRNIYDVLETNPLPPSCTIRIKPEYQTTSFIEKTELEIKKIDGVNDVEYARDLLYVIDRYTTWIYIILGSFGLILLIISIILLFNTIRLTIFARRDIIEIMALVGATGAFIKRPFVIEGFFQGMFGALLANGLLYLSAKVVKSFYFGLVLDKNIYWALLLAGAMIGMLASRLSVSKYLDHI